MIEFRPVLTSAPAEFPVSIEECKDHAIIGHDDDDSVILAAIGAAVAELDGFSGTLGRAIVTQTWQVEMPAWEYAFTLPVPNVSEVSVVYDDADGVEQAGPSVTLHAVSEGTLVRISNNWVAPDLHDDSAAPIRVSFTCGFGDPVDVPYDLKSVIMQRVAYMINDREGVSDPGRFTDRIVSKYRWPRV